MSWYRTGTVSVTNGSKTVTGVGTLFTTAVNVGDAFALVDGNLNPTGAWYEVLSVDSNTRLTLKQTYAGTTGSNKQYCVFNMVGNMTTPSFAQRLATFFASFQSLIDKPTVTPTPDSIPVSDSSGKITSTWVPDASDTAKGIVELATITETNTGTDTVRAITPADLRAWVPNKPEVRAGLGTTARRWIGEIPPATTTTVTILSRSVTNGARPAILTIYTSKGTGTSTCGAAKYIIYPSLSFAVAAQWGASGSAGGYESVVLSVSGDNLQATKADSIVGCCMELETLNNTNPWVSPSGTYFSI